VLTHLHIKNFAIIDASELELEEGMSALTGETGAGKSILLDALGLVLGARANTDSIQQGATRAQISATRATVNDIPVSIQTLKTLGQQLVSIHGQHAHQTLIKPSDQRNLLDQFAGDKPLLKVQTAFKAWQESQQLLERRESDERARAERLDLLSFQLREFDDLDIGSNSIHQWRANSERIMGLSQQALAHLEETAQPALTQSLPALTDLVQIDERLRESLDLIESACIQVEESSHMIRSSLGSLDHDDNRMAWLDQKLSVRS